LPINNATHSSLKPPKLGPPPMIYTLKYRFCKNNCDGTTRETCHCPIILIKDTPNIP